MTPSLAHFDALTRLGMKILALRENSKVPALRGWTDWDLGRNRDQLCRVPGSNLGMLLGDVVDVEGDSEEANRLILDLIGDHPHPAYRSAKSIHHLFANPARITHFRVGAVEFRGHGHQSVIPPSVHNGVIYQWLGAFRLPVPEMPDRLKKFYFERCGCRKNRVKPGHLRTWCSVCKEPVMLHRKRFLLEQESFRMMDSRWECRGCRTVDLRPSCRLIRGGLRKAPDA